MIRFNLNKEQLVENPASRLVIQVIVYIIGEVCIESIYRAIIGRLWRVFNFRTDVFVDVWIGESCFFAAAVTAIYIVSHCFSLVKTHIRHRKKSVLFELLGAAGSLSVGLMGGLVLRLVEFRLLEHLHYGVPYSVASKQKFPFENEAIYCLAIALTEETAFRAYLLPTIEAVWGTGLAVLSTSAIFSLAHLTNAGVLSSTENVFNTLTMTFSGGVLFALCFVVTRRLWLPVALHFSWDFFSSLAYGDSSTGTLPLGDLYFKPGVVNHISFILNSICVILVVAIIVRRGQWKAIPGTAHQTACSDDRPVF